MREGRSYYWFVGAIVTLGAIIKVIWNSIDVDIFKGIAVYTPMLNYSLVIAFSMIFIVSLEAIFIPFFLSLDRQGIIITITWRQLKVTPILFFSFYLTFKSSLSFNIIFASLILALAVLIINVSTRQSAFYSSNGIDCDNCLKTNNSIYYIEASLSIAFLLCFILSVSYFNFFNNGIVKLDILVIVLMILASTYSITFLYKVILYYKLRTTPQN